MCRAVSVQPFRPAIHEPRHSIDSRSESVFLQGFSKAIVGGSLTQGLSVEHLWAPEKAGQHGGLTAQPRVPASRIPTDIGMRTVSFTTDYYAEPQDVEGPTFL